MSSVTDFTHKGILFPTVDYTKENLNYVENEFQLLDDDTFTVAYPRSGTHWMMVILGLIQDDGNPTRVQSLVTYERSPWIESDTGLRLALKYPPPRLLTTHLPVQLFPKSFLQSKAKVIYVMRNPKDVAISLYYLTKMVKIWRDPVNMEDYLLKFLSGDVYYGFWLDHVKGWMELKDRPNFFYITYEELHQDLRGSVERICRFLGKDLSEPQINSVVENASFQAMRNNAMCNGSRYPDYVLDKSKGQLLRKGICGDWKNHLTAAQNEHFDRVYQESLRSLSVTFPWE